MREDKKKARQAAKLAELLGISAPVRTGFDEQPQSASREAEAVLLYVEEKGKGFTEKECERCRGLFAVNSYNVRFCSDQCRKAQLKDQGFDWDPGRPYTSRWRPFWTGGTPREHLVVGVNALETIHALQEAADANPPTHEEDGCPVGDHSYEAGCEFCFV